MRIFAGLLLLTLTSVPAQSTVCLSKSEAKQLWPRQHLYWYSKDHCWSNRRGPPRDIKIEPVRDTLARKYLYPLDSNGAVSGPFEDYCCWPSLDDLKGLAYGPNSK